MKKRIFGMLLVAALLLSGLQANAEGIRVEEVAVINNLETESIWEERAYLDEFNMPTDDYYISNSSAIPQQLLERSAIAPQRILCLGCISLLLKETLSKSG